MTIRIRPQTDDDNPAVAALLTAAFEDNGQVAALAGALRGRGDAGAALVAVDGPDHVVGAVHLSRAWVDAPRRLVDVLVLSPLAVAPARQSAGIGTTLLTAAREEARRMATPLLFLEGDPDYYGPRGWCSAHELDFVAPSTRIPDPAFRVVTFEGYDPAVMRGALIYNDTFWVHDCVGLR